jgi:hypothetical protein
MATKTVKTDSELWAQACDDVRAGTDIGPLDDGASVKDVDDGTGFWDRVEARVAALRSAG